MSYPPDVADEVLRSLRTVVRSLSNHSRHLAKDVGLTVPQMMCLRAAADLGRDGATVAAVAEEVELSAPTVSRILDRLERHDLIERHRARSDRRKVFIHVTAEGREILGDGPQALHQQFVERLADLGDEERETMLASLRLVATLMEIDEPPVEEDVEDDTRGLERRVVNR